MFRRIFLLVPTLATVFGHEAWKLYQYQVSKELEGHFPSDNWVIGASTLKLQNENRETLFSCTSVPPTTPHSLPHLKFENSSDITAFFFYYQDPRVVAPEGMKSETVWFGDHLSHQQSTLHIPKSNGSDRDKHVIHEVYGILVVKGKQDQKVAASPRLLHKAIMINVLFPHVPPIDIQMEPTLNRLKRYLSTDRLILLRFRCDGNNPPVLAPTTANPGPKPPIAAPNTLHVNPVYNPLPPDSILVVQMVQDGRENPVKTILHQEFLVPNPSPTEPNFPVIIEVYWKSEAPLGIPRILSSTCHAKLKGGKVVLVKLLDFFNTEGPPPGLGIPVDTAKGISPLIEGFSSRFPLLHHHNQTYEPFSHPVFSQPPVEFSSTLPLLFGNAARVRELAEIVSAAAILHSMKEGTLKPVTETLS